MPASGHQVRSRRLVPFLLLAALSRCSGDGRSPSTPDVPSTPLDHTLTVTVDGIGTGTVTSQPAGVSCPSTQTPCTGTFAEGTTVVLTAAPAEGMAFDGWSGACAGTGTCSVKITADVNVGASFDDPVLAVQEIGPEGGEIRSRDGRLTLSIPSGALSETQTISVRPQGTPGAAIEIPDSAFERSYSFGPDGLVFQEPASVLILTDQVANDSVAGVQFLVTVSADGTWGLLQNQAMVRSATSDSVWVRGEITHFSYLSSTSDGFTVKSHAPDEAVAGVPTEVTLGVGQWEYKLWIMILATADVDVVTGHDHSTLFLPKYGSDIEFTEGSDPDDEDFSHFYGANPTYVCASAGAATFWVDVNIRVTEGANPVTTTVPLAQSVECTAPPTVPSGVHSVAKVGVEQPYRANALGTSFHGSLPASALGLVTLTGEKADGTGTVVAYDPVKEESVLQRDEPFYVDGAVGAVTGTGEATLFAFGDGGYALCNAPAGGDFCDAPDESRTDIRVQDAVPAGGGDPTSTIVFASRDVGVGFVRFDESAGRFAVSGEVLPKTSFFGDPISAYIDAPDGPALVLARSSSSRLYFDARSGAAPVQVGSGLGSFVTGLRCLPPLCLVFPPPGTPMAVFTFDGNAIPVRVADVTLDFTPAHAALRRTSSGGVAALVIGYQSGTDHAVEIEFAADGSVLQTVPVTVPGECSQVGGALYVPDGEGVAGLVTCTGSDNYFVVRSGIFDDS